ncbi:DNA topoisomerase I [Marinomonas balearica]|uniref:Uncharacterized protein n=1 Tax=Marinomonas balearica TaxID=491947 RepID=A0A4R6ME21_9GAMM|nr:DNA topoisomerase I [Marinomonas balearica]TDP00019.1 hypothetical protein DFP79_1038 [Marinomonas balearica]
MATLQILTITILFIIVIVSVVVGTRAQQKEREATERKFKQLQLSNRAERVEQHVRGILPINTDNIATDALYSFYIDCLKELIDYSDSPEKIEESIAKAEEERAADPQPFTGEPEELSFQEKSTYKERLTKTAKMLLYMRRKGRISHTHYKLCYDYLRWLNLWLQLNRQLVQANKNYHGGDMRVAQTLYGVILSNLKSNTIDRAEKHQLEAFIQDRMKEIVAPQIMALQNAENPEEVIEELFLELGETPDDELLGESPESKN